MGEGFFMQGSRENIVLEPRFSPKMKFNEPADSANDE
jgi:hypothetical protein